MFDEKNEKKYKSMKVSTEKQTIFVEDKQGKKKYMTEYRKNRSNNVLEEIEEINELDLSTSSIKDEIENFFHADDKDDKEVSFDLDKMRVADNKIVVV